MVSSSNQPSRTVYRCAAILAVVYAFLAGLRTVADFDVGWMLSTGRYIVQHHVIPATDVLSYTARGNAFIYPSLSPILLYATFAVGGFAALAWLNAFASAATVALLVRRSSWVEALLAISAVPLIAWRTAPRADMFTTVLFAAFLVVLWRHRLIGSGPLWLLPILMILWANLHLGFVASLGLSAAYVLVEVIDFGFSERRAGALQRLRKSWHWLVLTAAVTLVNVWTWHIYEAIARQSRMTSVHSATLGEWFGLRLNLTSAALALRWRDPDSAIWWLLALAVAAAAVAILQREFGAAVILFCGVYMGIHHSRFQALFAILVVVIGGPIFTSALRRVPQPIRFRASLILLALVAALVSFRVSDLVTNRHYLQNGEVSLFGPGLSWWYPQRAVDFMTQEHVPNHIFNDYAFGGYLSLELGPGFPVYVDGRSIPYDPRFLAHYGELLTSLPDSPAWQQESDLRNINTIIVPTSRFAGLGRFPLAQFCQSSTWKPVYLDETAAIFVRNTEANRELLSRLTIHCEATPLKPPSGVSSAELYNYYANSGALLYVLQRDSEAMNVLERANRIFSDEPNLHLTLGQLLQAHGRVAEAEAEYQRANAIRPTSASWFALGELFRSEHRDSEAKIAYKKSRDLSPTTGE